jgi:hypothetical protein
MIGNKCDITTQNFLSKQYPYKCNLLLMRCSTTVPTVLLLKILDAFDR